MSTTAFDLLTSMFSQNSQSEFVHLMHFFQQLEKQVWPKDHYFFRQDEQWNQIILLETGLVRCFYIEDDREINLRFLCGGSAALPFSSFAASVIDKHKVLKSNEYIQAVSEVTGYYIPATYLTEQLKYPELNPLRVEIAARHYFSIEQRLRMIQNLKAIERYRKFLAWMPEEIIQQTTQNALSIL